MSSLSVAKVDNTCDINYTKSVTNCSQLKRKTPEGVQAKKIRMSENKLNFLKSQISVFNPDWTKEQIEMEAIRIYNEANTIDDDDEGCLYCGS
jgi:hypothetical protein